MPDTSLLPQHFEAYGKVADVIRSVEGHLLEKFPDKDEVFVETLKQNIIDSAATNNWNQVALIVDKGLARSILNDMARNPFPHKGGIIVDPTGSTPEYSVAETTKILKITKERLIEVNEQTQDILIILYGVDEVDRSSDFHLVQRHLRMAGSLLDMMMEEDEDISGERLDQGLLDQRNRNILLAKNMMLGTLALMKARIADPNFDPLRTEANSQIRMLYRTIRSLAFMPLTEQMHRQLDVLLYAVRAIPESFERLGLDLSVFLDEEPVMVAGNNVNKPLVPEQRYKKPNLSAKDFERLKAVPPETKPLVQPRAPRLSMGPTLSPE
jgi:hypothetical protein